jgi:hypothetical protein
MYIQTWKKYLPVIRILLKRSASAEQVFSVDRLDFEKVSSLRKPVCSFSIKLTNGRMSPFNPNVTGKDLFTVLMEDDLSRALIRSNEYHISMSNKYELQIKNANPAGEEIAKETQNDQSGE